MRRRYAKGRKPADPIKQKARRKANYAQAVGALEPEPCQRCGALLTQKHHPDYCKPLDIEWLCVRCHWEWHTAERAFWREFVEKYGPKWGIDDAR